MSKYVQWIEHKGKKIMFCNFAGLAGDEYMEAMEATQQEVLKLPEGSFYLCLMNVLNVRMTPEMTNKGREILAIVEKRRLTEKLALVGVSGLAASVAKLVQPHVHYAKDIEEAKEWLVKQGK